MKRALGVLFKDGGMLVTTKHGAIFGWALLNENRVTYVNGPYSSSLVFQLPLEMLR